MFDKMSIETFLDCLTKLQFFETSDEIVEVTASSEFIESPMFDLEFNETINSTFFKLVKFAKALQDKLSDESLLGVLSKKDLNVKRIQIWVYYCLNEGLAKAADFHEKQRALTAAQFFIVLLKEQGGEAYMLFHEILFQKSIAIMKLAAEANKISDKGNKRSKQPSRQRRSQITSSQHQDEDDDGVTVELSTNECVSLVSQLTEVLQDFCYFVEVFSFKNRAMPLKVAVEGLVEITKCFGEMAFTSLDRDISENALPNQAAYKALQLIIEKSPGKMSLLVFELLMTTITMKYAVSPSSGGSIPRKFVRQAEATLVLVNTVYNRNKDQVEKSVTVLLQNLISQCPERSEFRHHMATNVSTLLYKLSTKSIAEFVMWMARLLKHSRIGYRIAGLFVIGQLLLKPERTFTPEEEVTEELKSSITHKHMLQYVIEAHTDPAPTVRARALAVLADVMQKQVVSMEVFDGLLQHLELTGSFSNTSSGRQITATPSACQSRRNLFSDTNSISVSLLPLLTPRCSEEKVAVRRGAVQALEISMCKGFIAATKEALEIMKNRCRDPLLSVRKLAIQSTTTILMAFPELTDVQVTWMDCLLPSIGDVETSMQEKCIQLTEDIILNGILATGEKETLAWNLLKYLTTEVGDNSRIYLQKIIKQWNVQNKLTKQIAQKIGSYLTDNTRSACAWMLIRMFTLYVGDPSTADLVSRHWRQQITPNKFIALQMDAVASVGQVAKYMADEQRDEILDYLKRTVSTHHASFQLMGMYFEAIQRILDSQHEGRLQAQKPMDDWCAQLLHNSDVWLSDVILTSSQTHFNEPLLVNHLYIVGESAQRSPKNVPKRLILSIQALLTNPDNSEPDAHQTFSQPLSQFRDSGIPPAVRAHTILNLGRACFQNEALAKRVVPAMARELETCQDEAVRNNVLIVLTDLCVIQTQLVDQHLSAMATCLADESPIIRKHGVMMISSLLKKEYIKWRGTLLFKFLFACCDKNPKIRSLARYCLLEQHLRGPGVAGDLFFRNFVACIFYFNAYNEHNLHQFTKSDREKRLINLSGEKNVDRRMEIYRFLLDNFEDEHRINLTGKLCSDILDGFVECSIPLNDKTRHILTDSLAILCCKEIRLKSLKNKDSEQEEDEILGTQAEQNAIKQKFKQKIISQVVKRNLIENIVPIVIALKNQLTEKKSPLVYNVMVYLKEVTLEYKEEVQQILAADRQLACEIEFDLKRFEREEEEKRREEENAQSAARLAQRPVLQSVAAPSASRSRPSTPTSGRKSLPRTPQGGFVTPATTRRKSRPMNIQAILNSVRKAAPSAEKQPNAVTSPSHLSTPAHQTVTTRAASTPATVTDPDITFARDISLISVAPQSGKENNPPRQLHEVNAVLLSHPEKSPPPPTWNVTSPAPASTRRSSTRLSKSKA